MWLCSQTQCLKDIHAVPAVLVPALWLQRVKEVARTRTGTDGKWCPTKGSQQDKPMKEAYLKLSLLLYMRSASYVIHNAIHRLLVLFLLRWNFVSCSLHCPYIFCQVTTATTQRSSSEVLDSSLASELTTLRWSQGCLAQIPYF